MTVLIIALIPCLFFLSFFVSGEAAALEISGGLSLDAVNLSGENSYKTTFDGGNSLLKWPIDVKTVGINLTVAKDRTAEIEFGLFTKPWGFSNGVMKDYDYLDESRYAGRTPHSGADIYSESSIDSRALVFQTRGRIFPLQKPLFSAGFSAGYEYQEFDYHAYNTRQVGYDTWSDQTNSVTGLVSQYFLRYDMYSLGLTVRSSLEDIMIITIDASVLPYVTASDEDDHLRRNRLSLSKTRGYGYQADISGLFKIYKSWYLSSRINARTIHTDGHQDQYWYGDDPNTPHFDDSGSSLPGLGIKIDQETLLVTIGAHYRF